MKRGTFWRPTRPAISIWLRWPITASFANQPASFGVLCWNAAGGLDTDLQYAMDLDLWIRFGKLQQKNPRWKFKHIPQVLASSRMHSSNKTLSRRRQSLEEIMKVVRRHFGVVPFNWVYGAEESASGSYDGFFRRSPFRASLAREEPGTMVVDEPDVARHT